MSVKILTMKIVSEIMHYIGQKGSSILIFFICLTTGNDKEKKPEICDSFWFSKGIENIEYMVLSQHLIQHCNSCPKKNKGGELC